MYLIMNMNGKYNYRGNNSDLNDIIKYFFFICANNALRTN